jgi:ferredoxin
VDTLGWYPHINTSKCIGCGECVAGCPTHALGQVAERAALVVPAACTYCAACESICPVDAIALPYLVVKASDIKRSQS